MLRWGALEIEVVGVYICGCSDEVHSKLRLLECIFLGAQMGYGVHSKLSLWECIFLDAQIGCTRN